MIALPFKPRDKLNEELPSISKEMQRQTEAEQSNVRKQLAHAQQQLALTNTYPGRRGDTRSNNRRGARRTLG
jgi:hypothetical protein